jgi:serine/threonine protein kinase/tetratricopeptide (TPR) repeat protein
VPVARGPSPRYVFPVPPNEEPFLTDARAALEAGLAGHYTIERELGRGGMATVYLAHDERHDRSVALKVLHPELAHALGPERFQREIRLAARLQHPHILTVLDSGEAAGQLWFTMPFVEGESLRDRLHREKQLPLDDALRITREVADGLDYAHQHGVIHRDIKPENILLAGAHALVADFGIARGLTPDGQNLTETGTSIGTAAYMSPEQAAGERELDARSDIYSLATVLYEMLAGQTPFTAPTPQAMIARRFTESPRPLAELRDTVPAALSQVVQKALARTPADRYATAAEFAAALTPTTATVSLPAAMRRRRFPVSLATLAVGFVLGLGLLFAWRHGHGADDDAGPRMLAVLPFENLGAPGDEYFADGVADQVRAKLSSLTGVEVIARGSSTPYRKTTKSPGQIAQELGVRYLLTGTVRWERHADGTSRVQVSPELVEITKGRPTTRWGQPFDAALTDVFQVQGDIAGQVAQALDVALGDSSRRQLAERPTKNLAAYDAFLRGDGVSDGLLASDPATLREAAGYYEQAVKLDPEFAVAWARLGVLRSRLYYISVPTPALAALAETAVERAEAMAPNRVETRYARSSYEMSVRSDLKRAERELRSALSAAPSDVPSLSSLSIIELSSGAWDSALVHSRRAADIDPRSAAAAQRLGTVLRLLRRYPEATIVLDHGLALAPAALGLREDRAIASLQQGDLAGARAVVAAAPRDLDPAAVVYFFANYNDLAWVLDDAQQQLLLSQPVARFDDDRASWAIVRAQVFWLRGDQAAARAWGDTARAAFEAQLRDTPDDYQRHIFRGLSLAYMGSGAEAMREGERGLALAPAGDQREEHYLQRVVARICLLSGEPEKALDHLEPLVRDHDVVTPGWLRIDPNFAALRGNPRFDRLARGD